MADNKKEDFESINFESVYTEAYKNVKEDRKTTKEFLCKLRMCMSSSSDYAMLGFVAAKFVDCLMSSNRYLIELARTKKEVQQDFGGMTEDDIYDSIEEDAKKIKFGTTTGSQLSGSILM